MNLTPDTILFTGYAGMLMLGACALDRLAQHGRARSDRYRSVDPDHTGAPRGNHNDHQARPWPHSEADHFRRGLVLLPVGLAAQLLVVLIVQHHQPGDLAVIAVPLLVCGLLGYRFTQRFRRTPHGFPAEAPIEDRVGRRSPSPDRR